MHFNTCFTSCVFVDSSDALSATSPEAPPAVEVKNSTLAENASVTPWTNNWKFLFCAVVLGQHVQFLGKIFLCTFATYNVSYTLLLVLAMAVAT